MSELPKYFEDDQVDTCPFCGKVYPGDEAVEFEEWWAPTECSHMCCRQCSDWLAGYPLCPQFEFRTFGKRGIHIRVRNGCPGKGSHAR